jgi:hypothetical protein
LLKQEFTCIANFQLALFRLNQRPRSRIGKANGDDLDLTASRFFSHSSFSAIVSLQKAETFKQRLLFSRSSA